MRFVSYLILARGFHRLILALLLGAISALSMAPFHAFYVLFFTFPCLILMLDGTITAGFKPSCWFGDSFWVGWLFGFGYFTTGLYWIGYAFLAENNDFAWLLPLALIGLPALLSIFYGFATWFARSLWPQHWARLFSLAASFTLFEWLRHFVLTGFPWNSLGMSLAFSDSSMQLAHLFGVQGLTLLAVLFFSAPVLLIPLQSHLNFYSRTLFAGLMIGFLAQQIYGFYRLHNASLEENEAYHIRLVQPNIAQRDKWDPSKRDMILERYLSLSQSSPDPVHRGLLKTTHLIWPESAFPFLLTKEPAVLAAIAEMLPLGSSLITGAVREGNRLNGEKTLFNSVYLINDQGLITNAYDKRKLVPFGEKIPFSSVLNRIGFEKIVSTKGSFEEGLDRQNFTLHKNDAVALLICYEILFPSLLKHQEKRPQWVVNVTNDAWFGDSRGPFQHLHHARLRSVEFGLPIVRAANTGISALIDPYGRIRKKIALNQEGVLDFSVSNPLSSTFYSLYGFYSLSIGFILCWLFVGFGIFQERKKA